MLTGSSTNEYNLIEEETTYIRTDSFSIDMRMYHEPIMEPSIFFFVSYGNSFSQFPYLSIPFTVYTPREISMKIHDKWYYNVYYFGVSPKLYYSTEYGVLRVEFKDGDFIDYVGVNKYKT